MTARWRSDSGLSVIDLLVGSVLSMAILMLINLALNAATQTDMVSDQHSQALAELRTTTQRLTKELRQARRIYSDSNERTLHFWVDRNRDGDLDTGEQITWRIEDLDGTRARLMRETDTSTASPIAEGFLIGDAFDYRDATGAAIPLEATLVRLTFEADINPDAHAGQRDVRTEVRLRNVLA